MPRCSRIFALTETVKLELRVEAFNAFNHANFDLYTTAGGYVNSEIVTSPTFGQITFPHPTPGSFSLP